MPTTIERFRRLLVLVACLLAAVPARAAAPRVAMLGVSADQSMSESQGRAFEDLLLTALHETGRFQILGRSDIAGLLGFEKQQQAMGCAEDTSCIAQIAGALDVPLIATTSVAKFGSVTVLSFKLIDSKAAKVIVRSSVRAASDSAVPDAIQKLADEVSSQCDAAKCEKYAEKPAPKVPSAVAPSAKSDALPPGAIAPVADEDPAPPAKSGHALAVLGIVLGASIGAGSAIFDTQAASSHDHTLTAIDFVPVAGYVAAVALGGLGIHALVAE